MTCLPRNRILVGDALTMLRRLSSFSVDCVVTSPPYFALRNYQISGQIGLEDTVQEWVARLVEVLDEVGKVLKPQGVLWLNLGDSYSRKLEQGAPAKGLVLAPERVLLALSGRGWIVRNKVVWAKPNPMPASVMDRLTCSWEPLYLLTRSSRYYFDLDSIRVPHRSTARPRAELWTPKPPSKWRGPLAGVNDGLDRLKAAGIPGHPLGKNPGDVWIITKSNYPGHCAVFPPELVRRPLMATCPERVCTACGMSWRRERAARAMGRVALLGALQPECQCQATWQPGLVLDPFIGSGTVGLVAEELGRDWLGIELNPEFAEVARRRIEGGRGKGADEAA